MKKMMAGLRCGFLAAACWPVPLLAAEPTVIIAEMTPDLIAQAIKEGQAKPKKDFLGLRIPGPPPGQHPLGGSQCWLSTPFSRVVFASNLAFKEYRPFVPADVPPEMVTPEVSIRCHPRTVGRGGPDSVRAIVLTNKGTRDLVPALRSEAMEGEYQNAYGATYRGTAMTSVYPISAIVPGREIRVVYKGGDDVKVKLDLRGVR